MLVLVLVLVLVLDDAGPLTQVKLAPGRCSVGTRYGDHERTQAVEVRAGAPSELNLHDQPPAQRALPRPGLRRLSKFRRDSPLWTGVGPTHPIVADRCCNPRAGAGGMRAHGV
ncbi:hypothetical protein [Ideonella sp.]|uniref:hypothetical protein n=1 Tax=Ideonella sp. TaxID=1929293 RepID=UPI0035AF879A